MESLNRCFVKESGIVSRKVDGDIILVPIRNDVSDLECIYTLNEVAARIWELLDGIRTVKDIIDVVATEFEVDKDTATKDVTDFLKQLESIEGITEYTLKANQKSTH